MIYLKEMAKELGLKPNALRAWVRKAREVHEIYVEAGIPDKPLPDRLLPKELWPETETFGRKLLYWKDDQLEGMKKFAKASAARWGYKAKSDEDE